MFYTIMLFLRFFWVNVCELFFFLRLALRKLKRLDRLGTMFIFSGVLKKSEGALMKKNL